MIVNIDGNKIENPDLKKGRLEYMRQIGNEVYWRYVPYTQEELDRIEEEKNKPTMEDRLAALEEENKQLKEALDLLLSGETEEGETDG